MAPLALPFAGSLTSLSTVFEVTCDGGGGTAVQGSSLGGDPGGYGGAGVAGIAQDGGIGVSGSVTGLNRDELGGIGVYGECVGGIGIQGFASGSSRDGQAIGAEGLGPIGVMGYALGTDPTIPFPSDTTYGVVAWNPSGTALLAQGSIHVTGDLIADGDIFLTNADCAEAFTVSESAIQPGTVMVVGESDALVQCRTAYDRRVVGVISGAGPLKPAITLDKGQSGDLRLPLALIGKVYCKVDAQYSQIQVGDLLTSSPTPGCAMKATDPIRAFGSVIGKALQSLDGGQGLIPILVALQ